MNKGQLLLFLKQIQQLQNQEQISTHFIAFVNAYNSQNADTDMNTVTQGLAQHLQDSQQLEALLHVAQFINDPNQLLINQLRVSDFTQNALPGNELPDLVAAMIAASLQGVGDFDAILNLVINGIGEDPQNSISSMINSAQPQKKVADPFETPPQTPRDLEEQSGRLSDQMTATKYKISEEQQALHQQLTLKPPLQEALRVFNNSESVSSTDGRPGSSTDGNNNPGGSPRGSSASASSSAGRQT